MEGHVVQQNGASETFAALQSLLNTHTADDVELCCDNQGCVNPWDRMIAQLVQHDAGSRPGPAHRGNCAAMWDRIDRLRGDRTRKGSSAVMNWTQSHVQDEAKRVSTSSNIECALGYHVGSSNIAVQVGLPVWWISERVVG